MGRKAFDFSDEKIAQVEQMAGLGLPIKRMAGVLGISTTTFENYQRKNPAINEAIEKGKGKASFIVGKSLFNEAKDGNIAAIKWWESTRDDRSEKTRNEVTGKDGAPLGRILPNAEITEEKWLELQGGDDEAVQ